MWLNRYSPPWKLNWELGRNMQHRVDQNSSSSLICRWYFFPMLISWLFNRSFTTVIFMMINSVNQVPGTTTYSLALYYMMTAPLKDSPLLERFVDEDDAYRSSRFKLIPYISEVSIHKKAIKYDSNWDTISEKLFFSPFTFYVLLNIFYQSSKMKTTQWPNSSYNLKLIGLEYYFVVVLLGIMDRKAECRKESWFGGSSTPS